MLHVPKFLQSEAVEVRFHDVTRSFQLLATVSRRGLIHYTLNQNPATNDHHMSLSHLYMERVDRRNLPKKAYEGWQEDLLKWILSAKRKRQYIYLHDHGGPLMGLDNIPQKYPCKKQETAVMITRKDGDGNVLHNADGSVMTSIDCDATQANGGCPYRNDYEKSDLTDGFVANMFGADCWYRGKYGNYLIKELGIYNQPFGLSFYGALGEGTHKSPGECNLLADVMEVQVKNYKGNEVAREEVTESVAYAIWYLRWAAANTEGLECWY